MSKKYTQGYIPKIQYWVDRLLKASTPLEQANALSKVRYFQKRHKDVYGEVITIESLLYKAKEWKISSEGLERVG